MILKNIKIKKTLNFVGRRRGPIGSFFMGRFAKPLGRTAPPPSGSVVVVALASGCLAAWLPTWHGCPHSSPSAHAIPFSQLF